MKAHDLRVGRQTMVPTPWEGRWSDGEERDGMRVPLTGEVAWLTPHGRMPDFRATIVTLTCEFGP